jgi:uncharacterized LabA/DUF88 family protein
VNPWWLRPPAEEAPSEEEKPKQPAARSQEEKEPDPSEQKSAPSPRRSGRGRGSRRRSSPAGKTQSRTVEPRRIAVLYDVDDIAHGLGSAELQQLDLDLVLQRLAEKGRVVAKRAYGDMQRSSDQEAVVRAAGLEIIDTPRDDGSGESAAEMRLVLDAAELCFSREPCEIFVLISGKAGFVPLVTKLREAKAEVLGLGIRGFVSADLEKGCDDYLYHDALMPPPAPAPVRNEVEDELPPPAPAPVRDEVEDEMPLPAPAPVRDEVEDEMPPVFSQLVDTIQSLETGDGGIVWASTLKQEMRRRHPDFDASGLGYSTFADLLEDAERHEVIRLGRDDRSGGYFVESLTRQ